MVETVFVQRIGDDGKGNLAQTGYADHVELPRHEPISGVQTGIVEGHAQGDDVRRLRHAFDDARAGRHGEMRVPFDGIQERHRACTSSRGSMPTGQAVMQRPQPTQPLRPNCSCQVANLWVSHWR